MNDYIQNLHNFLDQSRRGGWRPRIDAFFVSLLQNMQSIRELFIRAGISPDDAVKDIQQRMVQAMSATEAGVPAPLLRTQFAEPLILDRCSRPSAALAYLVSCNELRDYEWITKYTKAIQPFARKELGLSGYEQIEKSVYAILNWACECYEDRLVFSNGIERLTIQNPQFSQRVPSTPMGAPESQKTVGGNPLALYCKDLCAKANIEKLAPVQGRGAETAELIEVLCRKTKNCPILIGEPGTGKTAIVESLARDIALGKVPSLYKDTRIYELSMISLMAGAMYRGQLEERVNALLQALRSESHAILFIDEIHMLVNKNETVNMANMFKPALSRGEIPCIGATTYDEYRNYIENDKALARRFTPIRVKEMSPKETLAVLEGAMESYGKWHSVEYTGEILKHIVDLTDRYITDRRFPDKALDIMDAAGAKAKIAHGRRGVAVPSLPVQKKKLTEYLGQIGSSDVDLAKVLAHFQRNVGAPEFRDSLFPLNYPKVQYEHVISAVAQRAGIPYDSINSSTESGAEALRIKDVLMSTIVGQNAAIDAIVKAIAKQRMGLLSPNRPFGSFMFAGPTGVGKTLVAKELAKALYPGRESFIRIDMSEYMEMHAVSRLIGAPPGYVGYDQAGQLSEKLRHNPHCLVLIDEVEKAHRDVLNIFLQILEDGRLTDGQGNVVDCTHAIFIFTTNAGTSELVQSNTVGFMPQPPEEVDVRAALTKHFAPELLNRIDAVIAFQPFGRTELRNILHLELGKLSGRLGERGTLRLTKSAIDHLIESADSEHFGARELRRLVELQVSDIVAARLCEGKREIVIEKRDLL